MIVLAGTRKGLFLLESDEGRRDWKVEGPLVPGWEIYHAILDPRDDVLYACSNTFAYGANVHRSRDRGKTWEHAEQLGLPEDGELKLEKTWHVEPGRDSDLWLGGAPGVLFRSDDGGVNWELVRGLFDHSTREQLAARRRRHVLPLDPDSRGRPRSTSRSRRQAHSGRRTMARRGPP